MAIIVETGTIIPNANSYISEADANAILLSYGLPVLVPAAAEAQLRTATDFLEGLRARYKGVKVSSLQTLQFPRLDLYIDDFLFPSNEIPNVLKKAQALVCNLIASGAALYTNSQGAQIIQKSVDVISVTYADTGIANAQPEFGNVDALLEPLLKPFGLRTLRI